MTHETTLLLYRYVFNIIALYVAIGSYAFGFYLVFIIFTQTQANVCLFFFVFLLYKQMMAGVSETETNV